MTRAGIAGTIILALLIAGCGSSKSASSSTTSAGLCSTAVSRQRPLSGVDNSFASIPGTPFGVATAPDGRYAFVSSPAGDVIDLISLGSGTPKLARQIRLPRTTTPLGLALTRNGRYLLAASNGGAVVLSVERAQAGAPGAVLGTLSAPARGPGARFGGGAIEVATSADGSYAFVSLEDQGTIAVFDLRAAITDDFKGSHLVGLISLGLAPVGMAISPDGRWLYATSELGGPPPGVQRPMGSITAIDVARAERDPARSVIATLPAGCGPVRVVTSTDGDIVWVTARESDELLAFSASRLRRGSRDALLAAVRVGEAPVGLEPVNGGRQIVVADSDRFQARGAQTGLTVVDATSMLNGRPSVAGVLRAGGFPREMSATPDGGTLLVTDYSSGQLQAVGVSGLR